MRNLFAEAQKSLTQAATQADGEIAKLREKRETLLEEVSFLQNGPLPKDEWIQRAEQAVDRLGEDHDLAGLRRVGMAHSGPEALAGFLDGDLVGGLKKMDLPQFVWVASVTWPSPDRGPVCQDENRLPS